MKLISVIIPVYKVEHYLERCINSILNQTYKNIELILIDDGSPDSCGDICNKYASLDSRVKVVHKVNEGVSVARNTGLELASGEYITFVDSDDYIDSNMYESMIEVVEKYNAEVVMCDCIKEYGNSTSIYSHNIREGYYDRKQIIEEYFPHLLIMPNIEYPATISNWLLLFKNKRVLRYEPGIRYSEDLLFGAQVMYQSNSFYYMKGSNFYHYNCTNVNSATHTYVSNKWKDYQLLYKKISEYFLDVSDYDFSIQVDKVLLFFVYNAVGEIIGLKDISLKNKIKKAKVILNDIEVKHMFKRLNVRKLPITNMLKLQTLIYKYQIGLRLFCIYKQRKG